MVLSDHEIWMEIGSERLTFDPALTPDQVSPSSIDLRLSNQFTTLNPPLAGATTTIDLTEVDDIEKIIGAHGEETNVPEGGTFPLSPGAFVLAYTREYIALPNYLSARVEGRSSLARIGISIHQTAPTVHATYEGQLRLEILNNGPFELKLHPGMRFCQLIIERIGSPAVSTLRSRFQRQRQT